MSDSAHAQRRQLLPLELFEQILDAALSPLASSAPALRSLDGTGIGMVEQPIEQRGSERGVVVEDY